MPVTATADTALRVRVHHAIGEPLCYTSVLDMGRHWERLLRRARIPLAYSQGYHPHPRILFAAPLPVGYRATDELLDIVLDRPHSPAGVRALLLAQSPRGLEINEVEAVAPDAPVLQSLISDARYTIELWSPASEEDIRGALAAFESQTEVVRTRERKGRLQEYNLRELFSSLAYAHPEHLPLETEPRVHQHVLEAIARCGSRGSGRPEELIDALGVPYRSYRITRTGLIWSSDKEGAA